jgi:hypothetical protein
MPDLFRSFLEVDREPRRGQFCARRYRAQHRNYGFRCSRAAVHYRLH